MNGETKIALLSNTNMNYVIRQLKKHLTVLDVEGYGNELGILMDPQSSYHTFQPGITFLVMDLLELIRHETDRETAGQRIGEWFAAFESAVSPRGIYYLSDAKLRGPEFEVQTDPLLRSDLEEAWRKGLQKLCEGHENIRVLPYAELIGKLGEENAYSEKTWALGKILLSGEAQKRLTEQIFKAVRTETQTAKKLLVLDLDNTLWGGLAGEADHEQVLLSEESGGLAYKNLQRVILQMQRQGVLLAIVSKNNEEDAMEILEKHPHMVLRPECFAARKINWLPKPENLTALSQELNLGLDSFVFWDDSPAERELVKQSLPQVCVPDFPEKPEEFAGAMARIFDRYFRRPRLTREDLEKTSQYRQNARRKELEAGALHFDDYLKSLKMVVTRVNPAKNQERLLQLFNKTNQFNLTTLRHTQEELSKMLEDPSKEIFFYRVEDCFGDNGLVAALVLEWGEIPLIREFVMSCRVMGRRIEQVILTQVAKAVRERGACFLRAAYVPTGKNKPVEQLYPNLGARLLEEAFCRRERELIGSGDARIYEMDLARFAPAEGIAEVADEYTWEG